MGFRTTYISENYDIEWPEWFKNKYNVTIGKVIYSIVEEKFPDSVVRDTWKALKELKWFEKDSDIDFNIVLLHECGGVTKAQMGKDYLIIADPERWNIVESISSDKDYVKAQGNHMYCYGCSDLRDYKVKPDTIKTHEKETS